MPRMNTRALADRPSLASVSSSPSPLAGGPQPGDRRLARRHDAAPPLRQDVRHQQAPEDRERRHPAHARRRARRALFLDLGAERRDRADRRQARVRPDRCGARGRAPAPERSGAGYDSGRDPPCGSRQENRRTHGRRGWPHDRRRHAAAQELRRARRPLHDAHAFKNNNCADSSTDKPGTTG